VDECRDLKFSTHVACIAISSQDDKPSLKGARLHHLNHFICGDPIHSSGMAEARVVKLCTQINNIKSYQTDDLSPLNEAW